MTVPYCSLCLRIHPSSSTFPPSYCSLLLSSRLSMDAPRFLDGFGKTNPLGNFRDVFHSCKSTFICLTADFTFSLKNDSQIKSSVLNSSVILCHTAGYKSLGPSTHWCVHLPTCSNVLYQIHILFFSLWISLLLATQKVHENRCCILNHFTDNVISLCPDSLSLYFLILRLAISQPCVPCARICIKPIPHSYT